MNDAGGIGAETLDSRDPWAVAELVDDETRERIAELVWRTLVKRAADVEIPWPPWRRADIRTRADVTQADAAAAVGVSVQTLARWESGTFEPSGIRRVRYRFLLDQLQSLSQDQQALRSVRRRS